MGHWCLQLSHPLPHSIASSLFSRRRCNSVALGHGVDKTPVLFVETYTLWSRMHIGRNEAAMHSDTNPNIPQIDLLSTEATVCCIAISIACFTSALILPLDIIRTWVFRSIPAKRLSWSSTEIIFVLSRPAFAHITRSEIANIIRNIIPKMQGIRFTGQDMMPAL